MGYWTTATLLRGVSTNLIDLRKALKTLCKKSKAKSKIIDNFTVENVVEDDGMELLNFIQSEISEIKDFTIYINRERGLNANGDPSENEGVEIFLCDYQLDGLSNGAEIEQVPPSNENSIFQILHTKLGFECKPKLRVFHYYG